MPIGRINRLLQRLLELKGNAPVPELAPELMSAVVLECDRPEYKYLAGEQLAWGAIALAAGAGRAEAQLLNPSGSNCLIVVERIRAWSGVCNTLAIGPTQQVFATAVTTARRRDFRGTADLTASALAIVGQVRGKNDSAVVVTNTTEFIGGVMGNTAAAAGPTVYGETDTPIVLAPGWSVGVQGDVDAGNLRASFVWRERALENAER